MNAGTFLEHVCPGVGSPGRNLRRPGPGWYPRHIGEERNWLLLLGHAAVQGCWMLPKSPGSHRQEMFCCNSSWHVGSWSHQHTDWGVGTSEGRWCESRAWRFADVNEILSWDVYAQPLNFWLFWRLINQWPFQPLVANASRPCFLLRTDPANEKLGITCLSAVVQWVSCRTMMEALFL